MKREARSGAQSVALVLCASSSLLVGCRKVDSVEVEERINKDALARGWNVASVSCPAGIAKKQGNDFRCTLRFDDGQKLEVRVKQMDDARRFEWEPTAGVISIHEVEGQLVKTWPDVKLTCGGRHELIVGNGETMPCVAEHGGETSAFHVVSDGDGWNTVPVPTYR